MVVPKLASLKEATRIDFTGLVPGSTQFETYGDAVLSLIRGGNGPEKLVVIDRGFALDNPIPHVVRDHLNLTGDNPLVGPNDPMGERFPSVNDIYVTDLLPELPRGVAVGLKPGAHPSTSEWKLVRDLGGEFYCYNLVPAMIVAAHARRRVLGIVVPPDVELETSLLSFLTSEGGSKK